MRNIVLDGRDALRQWRRTPVITAAALLSLTLGIGASTAMFSLLNALLLKSLPVYDPQQLVTFTRPGSTNPLNFRLSYLMFDALRRDGGGLNGVAAYGEQPVNIAPAGQPARSARALFVSGSYFGLLGVPAARGRMLTDADDDLGAPARVAVVSDAFWRGTLGADPDVVGRTIDIVHQPFTIVGVVDRRFLGLTIGQGFDVALPVTSYDMLYKEGRLKVGQLSWLVTIGRLPAGAAMSEVEAGLQPVQARVIRGTPMPDVVAASLLKTPWRLMQTATAMAGVRVSYQRPLLILLGITGIVLAVACVNIANLLIARMTTRRSELAVRLALGATRAQLVRQLALEAAVMSAVGAAAGIIAGIAGGRLLVWLLSTSRNPVQLDLAPDWRVAAFAAAAGALTAIIAGTLPAWRSLKLDPIDAIKARAGIGVARRLGVSHVLIGGQIALTFVLVLGGLVFSQSFARLVAEERGFDRGRIQLVEVNAPAGYASPLSHMSPALQERLRAVPGVADAAFSISAPFGTVTLINYASVNGPQTGRKTWPEEFHTIENTISANYFDAMGMRLLAGRGFAGTGERADAIVVNGAFSRKFFKTNAAVGRVVWVGLDQAPHEIVGVVNDTKARSLRDEPPAMLYRSWRPEPRGRSFVQLVVRAASVPPAPAAMAHAIEALVAGSSVGVRSLDVEVADTIAAERAMATLAFVFALSGLLLAAIGLYGVLAREVQVRLPEIAIRMAIGASPARVRRLVMIRMLAALLAGLAAGVAAAIGLQRFVRALLHGVDPSDAVQVATCAAIMIAVAIAAVAAPVRRATRVDPMAVLRSE